MKAWTWLLFCGLAFGQGSIITSTPVAVNSSGQPILATIAITTANPCGSSPTYVNCGGAAGGIYTGALPPASLATTYTDITLGTPCAGSLTLLYGAGCSNPGTTDGRGNMIAFTNPGTYYCTEYGSGVTAWVQPCIFPASGTGVAAGSAGAIQSRTGLGNFNGDLATVYAAPQVGADCGAKINAAQGSACSGVNVRIVVTPTCGTTWTTAVNVCSGNTLDMENGTYSTASAITLYASAVLLGRPAGHGTGTASPPVVIKQTNGSNLNAVVQCGDGSTNGNNCVVQDVMIDVNGSNNASSIYGLLANKSSRFEWFRTTVKNSPSHGLGVVSSTNGNESCCGQYYSSMTLNNTGSGIFIKDSSDLAIFGRTEFENNTRYGIECQTCGGLHVLGNDLATNALGGISLTNDPSNAAGSSNVHIIGNRLVNNNGPDILITGQAVPFNGTEIFGNNHVAGATRTDATSDAIIITGSSGNTITGEHIQGVPAHRYRYGVNIVAGTSGDGWNQVGVNNFDVTSAAFGTSAFVGTSNTAFCSNLEGSSGLSRLCNPYLTNNLPLKWLNAGGTIQSILNYGADNNIYLANGGLFVQPVSGTTAFQVTANGISKDDLHKHKRFVGVLGGTCPTGGAIGNACTSANLSWTTTFADTNYTLTCSLAGTMTGQPHIVNLTKAAGSFTVTIAADTAAAANLAAGGEVDCVADHDP